MSSTPTSQSDVFAIRSMRNTSPRASPMRADARVGVFHIEEILHTIILHLASNNDIAALGEPQFPKRDILNIALSNKSASNPALDVLWSDMHSLAPFLRLLPHVMSRIDGPIRVIGLTGLPPAFHKYARRLRTLTLGNDQSDIIPLSYVLVASLCTPGSPMFPGLKSVAFTHNHIPQTMAMYGVFTLSSPITRLEFTALELETTTFFTMLFFFSDYFPTTLRHLNLTLPVEGRVFTMDSLRFLPKFQALHSLKLSSANVAFPIFHSELMDWILNLGSLEVFELNIRAEPTESALDAYRGRHAASACVRTLKLTGSLDVIYLILPMFDHCGAHVTKLALTPICEDEVSFGPLIGYVTQKFPNAGPGEDIVIRV